VGSVEPGEQLEVDGFAVGFVAFGGVGELVGQRLTVVFGGGEVRAGFADGFVASVERGGSGAVAVTEQSVGFPGLP
jgi:hypothetical protein